MSYEKSEIVGVQAPLTWAEECRMYTAAISLITTNLKRHPKWRSSVNKMELSWYLIMKLEIWITGLGSSVANI